MNNGNNTEKFLPRCKENAIKIKMIKETLKKRMERRIKKWPLMSLKKGHNRIKYRLTHDMTWEFSECIDLKDLLHSKMKYTIKRNTYRRIFGTLLTSST